MLDAFNKYSYLPALKPQAAARNATTAGDTVDRATIPGNGLVFVIISGTITDGTHVFGLEHSDDGTTWTAVAAPYMQTQPSNSMTSATAAGTVTKIGYLGADAGAKRYVRVKATVTGATTGGFYSGIAHVSYITNQPAA